MTIWLTLLLLCSAWTRPIGETARVWALSLPLFLLLDLVRQKASPERGAYLAWLGPALATARRGEAWPRVAGKSARLVAWYGPLVLLAAYIGAFIFTPEARAPGEAIAQVPAIEWAYRVIGAWYPAATNEPAHILALGHPQDAEDLRHFIVAVLVFSLGVAFVTAGPGRREFVEWWLLRPIRSAVERRGHGPRDRKLFRIALGQAFVGGLVLTMFAGSGILDVGLKGYWRLEVFPPCVMFTLSSWLLSEGIAAVGALSDAAAAERDVPSHEASP